MIRHTHTHTHTHTQPERANLEEKVSDCVCSLFIKSQTAKSRVASQSDQKGFAPDPQRNNGTLAPDSQFKEKEKIRMA